MHEIKPLVAVLHAHALSATSPEMRDTVIELAILVKKRDAYKEAIFMAGGIVPLVKLLDCHVVTDDSTYPLSIARRARLTSSLHLRQSPAIGQPLWPQAALTPSQRSPILLPGKQ